MPIGTITVAVNDKGYPVAGISEGKKTGYAKSADTGKFISLRQELVESFRKGGTFKFEFETFGAGGRIATKILEHSGREEAQKTEPSTGGKQQSERSLEIWINSMLQRAADHDKLDLWNEEACCELGEIQKRVYRRLFLGEEPEPPQVNGSASKPDYSTGPAPGREHAKGQKFDEEMGDSIPF